MSRTMLPGGFTALLLTLLIGAVAASTPTFWQASTQADFLKGEVENLTIDSEGRVLLGPAPQLVDETTAPFLWSLIATPDGGLLAGSGNDGKVIRVDKSGAASTFFDAPELEAHALAAAPDGTIYVGTSPDGKIYKVDRDGKSTSFFDPEDTYIWSLVLDRDGNLYAGTGDKGVIYKIDPHGTGTPFYETKATNVTALALDRNGQLLAGTESPGKVFRIDNSGKAFVLLDSSFREIHTLRVDDKGFIYAAAFSAKPGVDRAPERPSAEPARPTPTPTVSTEITAITIGPVQALPSAPEATRRRDDARGPQGAVYRIAPDGIWDSVWESPEDSPYDLLFDPTGALLVGTGNKGKIFRVSGDPASVTLVTRAGAQQVTSMLRDGGGQLYYATANPGKIFKLSSERAAQGTYESEVRDATTVATWGSIRWRAATPAGTQVQLLTRSGNTATPDATWSAWSKPYTRPTGEQITSPNARYLQWRAVLSGKEASPILTSVTAAYLERNLRPEVASITVHPPGVVFQKPFSTGELEIAGYDDTLGDGRPATAAPAGTPGAPPPAPPLGRRVYQKGLQTFVWKAEDENSDRLQYDVLYRLEGETTWRALRRGLSDPILVWDTSSVPDGTYTIKVVASDAPSNSPGTALSGEIESTAFDIDNTPPIIEIGAARREGNRTLLPFTVHDAQSPVQRVEYSLDANRWRVIYPKDGIPDSRLEEFEIGLDGDPGVRNVIIRATDGMNNASTGVGGAPASQGAARP